MAQLLKKEMLIRVLRRIFPSTKCVFFITLVKNVHISRWVFPVSVSPLRAHARNQLQDMHSCRVLSSANRNTSAMFGKNTEMAELLRLVVYMDVSVTPRQGFYIGACVWHPCLTVSSKISEGFTLTYYLMNGSLTQIRLSAVGQVTANFLRHCQYCIAPLS